MRWLSVGCVLNNCVCVGPPTEIFQNMSQKPDSGPTNKNNRGTGMARHQPYKQNLQLCCHFIYQYKRTSPCHRVNDKVQVKQIYVGSQKFNL
jgi:hypothetical protein